MDLAFFIACVPGLEPLLTLEVSAISGEAEEVPGGVEARGDVHTLARLLVELGLASHVLIRVASFRAKELDDLESHVARLPWSGWLRRGIPRSVRATTQRSKLYHTGAIAERIGRAIATRLGDDQVGTDSALAPDPTAPSVPIVVRMVNDRCTLSLDATGEPLHRRGYRLDPGRAPLREDLARALILASGWDAASLLVDPMCGSGTIAIEAALLALDRPPNLDRRFALEHTALDPDGMALAAARDSARARIHPSRARILARDRDPRAFAAARANAERAGVLEEIELEHGALSTTLASIERSEVRGATPRIVTNPPWGARLGHRDDLKPLYRALGQLRRALDPHARLALAAHDRRLAYATAIELHSAFLTRLGGLELNAMVETEPLQKPHSVSQ